MVDQPLSGPRAADGKPVRTLRVFVASHCTGVARALELAAHARAERPAWHVVVVDLDKERGPLPSAVIATPMYLAGDHVIFWGNPAAAELLQRLDDLAGREAGQAGSCSKEVK